MIVATGYYEHPTSHALYRAWHDNTRKFLPDGRIYVINSGGAMKFYGDGDTNWINLSENIGHSKYKPQAYKLSGWSNSFLMGCLLAYGCGQDLIYKEGDCFAFGPWVARLEKEIGAAGMITGADNVGGDADGLQAQSLVLVRHWYLLELIERFLAIPRRDDDLHSEHKFKLIGQANGKHAVTTMGYDRTRPIGYDDEAFYVQQMTLEEMVELKERGLI